MAITTNHTIDTTLRKAIDYILNPDKTDAKLLVHAYACTPEIADIEFDCTREHAYNKGEHLARHIIQAFSPGETTPEQAHEIGKRFADELLGGKFEYILTTHIDKGHIHNHIICNDVSFVDYKHIHINEKWYNHSRRINDRLCKEYGLSVVEPNAERKNKNTKYENKPTSWRAKLKTEIDKIIPQVKDFEDFLRLMELQGYEIKRGQYISVRAKGQERFIRLKAQTLGERYSVEGITKRIEKSRKRKPIIRDNRISLIIDIQNCIKAQESKGYEHWAKINNLKQASKTINFLTEHGITTYDELENKIAEIQNSFDDTAAKLKTAEKQLSDVSILRKHLRTYQTLRPVYAEYKKAKNKPEFEKQHRRELTLYNASRKYLSDVQNGGKLPSLEKVNTDFTELSDKKRSLYEKYKKERKALSEIDIIKKNVDMMLGEIRHIGRDNETEIE